jgi:hypothetical protein
LFSAVSWAALSPASWAVVSFDLNGLGDGDAALDAAKTFKGDCVRAKMAALTIPPMIIEATTTDPKIRLRVLFIRPWSAHKLTTFLESGVSFGPLLFKSLGGNSHVEGDRAGDREGPG